MMFFKSWKHKNIALQVPAFHSAVIRRKIGITQRLEDLLHRLEAEMTVRHDDLTIVTIQLNQFMVQGETTLEVWIRRISQTDHDQLAGKWERQRKACVHALSLVGILQAVLEGAWTKPGASIRDYNDLED